MVGVPVCMVRGCFVSMEHLIRGIHVYEELLTPVNGNGWNLKQPLTKIYAKSLTWCVGCELVKKKKGFQQGLTNQKGPPGCFCLS